MAIFEDILIELDPYMEIIYLILTIIIVFTIFSIILRIIKRQLLKKIKKKKQVANVIGFFDLLKFLFILFMIIVVVIVYYGDWGDVGFIAGLLTVALGMALQKPITSVFAWLIFITRKPISIGDRVSILNMKGDIRDITLTHIYLEEVGGTVEGEEKSNRTIILPTLIIFEQEIINYTEKDDYILDEVIILITYESNLENAEKIMIKAVGKIMKPFWDKFPKKIPQDPHIRLKSKDSGVDVIVRYYTIATKRNAIATNIIREILSQIRKSSDVEIAYPHTQVLLPENKKRI